MSTNTERLSPVLTKTLRGVQRAIVLIGSLSWKMRFPSEGFSCEETVCIFFFLVGLWRSRFEVFFVKVTTSGRVVAKNEKQVQKINPLLFPSSFPPPEITSLTLRRGGLRRLLPQRAGRAGGEEEDEQEAGEFHFFFEFKKKNRQV